ncbi:MAG: hypothetical protein RLZZ401_1375 [Pseudomonadota bacterium]|jgi:hypothetical protein
MPARLAFADLVLLSVADKALVSRTLRLLEARGLHAQCLDAPDSPKDD